MPQTIINLIRATLRDINIQTINNLPCGMYVYVEYILID